MKKQRYKNVAVRNGVLSSETTAFRTLKKTVPRVFAGFSSGAHIGNDQFFVFAPSKAELARILDQLPVGQWSPKNFQAIAIGSAKHFSRAALKRHWPKPRKPAA